MILRSRALLKEFMGWLLALVFIWSIFSYFYIEGNDFRGQGPSKSGTLGSEKSKKDTLYNTMTKGRGPYFDQISMKNQKIVMKYNEICDKQVFTNLEFSKPMYVDRNLKFLLTVPPKTGSSSWLLMIAQYYNFTFNGFAQHEEEFYKKTGIKKFYDLSSSVREVVLKDYKKVLIVRNPWYRLFSAYNDKILKNKYNISKIISNMNGKITFGVDKVSTFSDFIQYLIDIQIHRYQPMKIKDDSFMHFAPYYIQIDPCDVKYDIIVKLEDLYEDYAFLNKFLFDNRVKLKHIHKTTAKKHRFISPQLYLQQLSKSQYEKIYNIYKPDFYLFNYDKNIQF